MTSPSLTFIDQDDTHRLVPSKFDEDALSRIADDEEHLQTILEIESLTNDRVGAENSNDPDISPLELVSGFRHSSIVNGAFCHPHPEGSRFNGPLRGAWYSAFERETALREVLFHRTLYLTEIDYFHDEVEYSEYLSDFKGEYHDIREDEAFRNCLDPDSYTASQSLADRLLKESSAGILYPSVRHDGGTNIVCFRPALVYNVRRSSQCRFKWDGKPEPLISWPNPDS